MHIATQGPSRLTLKTAPRVGGTTSVRSPVSKQRSRGRVFSCTSAVVGRIPPYPLHACRSFRRGVGSETVFPPRCWRSRHGDCSRSATARPTGLNPRWVRDSGGVVHVGCSRSVSISASTAARSRPEAAQRVGGSRRTNCSPLITRRAHISPHLPISPHSSP